MKGSVSRMTDNDALSAVRVLRVYSRIELPMLFFAAIPSLLPMIFAPFLRLKFEAFMFSIGGITAGLVFLLGCSAFFEFIRSLLSIKTEAIPERIRKNLDRTLANFELRTGLRLASERIRVIPKDLSVGAHVRGVFRPNVIISGGALVGLMRGDPTAKTMLAHEIGHIQHFDKFYLGLIFIVILELLLSAYQAFEGWWSVTHFALLTAMLRHISRRREFAADAHALLTVGTWAGFKKLLYSPPGYVATGRSFFHPRFISRRKALHGFRIMHPSVFWCVVWIGYILYGLQGGPYQSYRMDSFYEAFAPSMVILGIFGFLIEMSKFSYPR